MYTYIQETVKMELEHQISFVQNVMSPLIGQSYLVPSVSLMHLYFGIRLIRLNVQLRVIL